MLSEGDWEGGKIGLCNAVLVEEFGVIHVRGALSDEGQRDFWALTKPLVKDPKTRAAGFSNFCVSHKYRKGTKAKRSPQFDRYGSLLFKLSAKCLAETIDAETAAKEPAYRRLVDLSSGTRPLKLDQIFGNYYRAEAGLNNHVDADGILFSMSLAIGDDCEFVIGRPTNRSKRMTKRRGKAHKIRMRSGDAIFFDGGSVPHEVTQVFAGTGPSWWEEQKVPNGARCVCVFREREESFYKRLKQGKGW